MKTEDGTKMRERIGSIVRWVVGVAGGLLIVAIVVAASINKCSGQ